MLGIENLSVSFSTSVGLLRKRQVCPLRNINLAIGPGELLGIVGASGAGKSLLAHAIVGLLPPNAACAGRMRFAGEPLDQARQAMLRGRRITLVPQSVASLDPMARVGRQVSWAAQRAGMHSTLSAPIIRDAAARTAAARFDLDPRALRSFPHELSGGTARRVLLAMATMGTADLVIADEPTTGLDVETIGRVMQYFKALARKGKAVLIITHDIGAVVPVADRIVVMRDGESVETVPAASFRGRGEGLATDYARFLWQALPQNEFAAADPASRSVMAA